MKIENEILSITESTIYARYALAAATRWALHFRCSLFKKYSTDSVFHNVLLPSIDTLLDTDIGYYTDDTAIYACI